MDNVHTLFPPTLQVVNPVMSPVTLHVKVKVPSEHVGGAAVNCPVAAPAWRGMDINVLHGSPTIQRFKGSKVQRFKGSKIDQ